jgi:Uma2 family endonuclease
MAGGSPAHAALIATLTRLIGNQLEGRPCRVFSSDLRIRVRETGLATTNPRLLVEVLSPSTEEYDRGEKLAHYKRIPGLRDVLLVAQAEERVELWSRPDDASRWTLAEFREHSSVRLPSLPGKLSLADVYRDPSA